MQVQAWAAPAAAAPVEPLRYDAEIEAHQVLVEVEHCGICHSDIHLIDGDWRTDHYPLVAGHEVVGRVAECGSGVRGLAVGDRVGIGWQCGSCGTCDQCTNGHDNFCRINIATAGDHHGGFASHVVADERLAVPIPEGLDAAATAPMLCGGVTVWTPLRRNVKPGDHVVVHGIGGLGHLAIKFAKAMGCKVTAVSRSADKADQVAQWGADLKTGWGGIKADFIVATAPVAIDWDEPLSALKPLGTLCIVGAVPDDISFNAFQLIVGSKKIIGSGTGGRAELMDMLAFAALHGIGADIERFPMDDINAALDHVRDGKARYRVVLDA